MLLGAAGMCGFTAGHTEDGIRYSEEAVEYRGRQRLRVSRRMAASGPTWAANYLLAGRMEDAPSRCARATATDRRSARSRVAARCCG